MCIRFPATSHFFWLPQTVTLSFLPYFCQVRFSLLVCFSRHESLLYVTSSQLTDWRSDARSPARSARMQEFRIPLRYILKHTDFMSTESQLTRFRPTREILVLPLACVAWRLCWWEDTKWCDKVARGMGKTPSSPFFSRLRSFCFHANTDLPA